MPIGPMHADRPVRHARPLQPEASIEVDAAAAEVIVRHNERGRTMRSIAVTTWSSTATLAS